MIKRFEIKKLFGFRNVNITFGNDIKILIGENGLGKTTILNSLYFVLTEKYAKLFQIEFEKIILEFKTKEIISFTKEELGNYLHYGNRRNRNRLSNQILDIIDVEELHKYIENKSQKEKDLTSVISMFIEEFSIPKFAPNQFMIKEIINVLKEPLTKKFRDFNNILKEKNLSILYFPTYRRVEEDLKNIGAVVRNADVLGVGKVYVVDDKGILPNN